MLSGSWDLYCNNVLVEEGDIDLDSELRLWPNALRNSNVKYFKGSIQASSLE